jgi:hypothetical protein
LNLKRNSDLDWEQFAKIDAYYAVATKDQYHKSNLDDKVVAQFFESGEKQVDQVLQIIDAHLVPGFRPQRALDFGCGVGRLVVPLGGLCQSGDGLIPSSSIFATATVAQGWSWRSATSDAATSSISQFFSGRAAQG